MQVKNVPMFFDIEDNYWEKIFIENARFENISGPAFNISVENNSNNSITLRNVWCSNVPVLAAFSGFGTSVAVLESYKGSDDNILNGIGISTGAFNYRAVGLKWTAGSGSYVNDVKFIGGHGSMWKPVAGQKAPKWSWGPREVSTPDKPVREQGMDQAWDTQYWSLWVTDGGGGIFKDIWTANTYASNGFYAENTSTEGRIYAMSIEHHVRNEVRFRNVSNWKVYCMQTEEETVESSECQPVEMDGCRDITFANLYMFRVIRVVRPYYSAVRLRGCSGIEFLNVHNYAQTKYTTDIAVFDQNKGIEVRPWEFSRLIVKGDEQQTCLTSSDGVRMLAGDFDFTEGIACDSKGAHIRTIHIPERPSTLTIIRDKLYITARKAIYRADL